MSPAHCAPPTAYPQITTDERWYRDRNGDWDLRPCFRFTDADGTWSTADGLFEHQRVEFERQEKERSA